MGLVDTHAAIIVLQAFTAFGVFLMKQFYDTVPYELNEAAKLIRRLRERLIEQNATAKII